MKTGIRPPTNQLELHLSFFIDGKLLNEYIPANTPKWLHWLLDKRVDYLLQHGKPIYYNHFRHMMPHNIKKMQDLNFLKHVYDVHDGQPTDRKEFKIFERLHEYYGEEYSYLIRAKNEAESENKGVEDIYARAYYRKWLRKKVPEISLLYHGADAYDYITSILIIKNSYMKELRTRQASSYRINTFVRRKNSEKINKK